MTRSDIAAPVSLDADALVAVRARVVGEVTAGLLHAMGQPLTILRLAAERPGAEAGVDGALVAAQVSRLEAMVQGLDALARAGSGPERQQGVMDAVDAALSLLGPLAAPAGPEVVVTAAPEGLDAAVEGPDGMLGLLVTAIAHHALTTARRRVRLTLGVPEDGRALLQVETDAGWESPPRDLAALTAMIGAHVLSDRGGGLTLDLLAQRVTRTGTAMRSSPDVPRVGTPARHDAAHVMVVEDELLVAEMLSDILDAQGYRTTICASVGEALEALKVEVPDVVVADLSLPGVAGEVLLDHMARDWPQVFTVAMSGRDLDRSALTAGEVDLVLRKPIVPETLLSALATLLETPSDE